MASTSGTGNPPIVLYHYPFSPFGRRVVWYLNLRGIPYKECVRYRLIYSLPSEHELTRLPNEQFQPPVMPRPDVERLGISYRRIPLLSIGRDVYLDTRLIIQKLEALYPEKPRLGAAPGGDRALEQLLQRLNIDSGIFGHAFSLLPAELPLLKDPAFLKDRGDFMNGRLTSDSMGKGRPEAILEMKNAFNLLEHDLLADGREWVLGTDGPRVADIEAIWPYHWLTEIPGALPADTFSPTTYPKVYAWIGRFKRAVRETRKALGPAEKISGADAVKLITAASWSEAPGSVDAKDSVVLAEGLKAGDLITMWPTDTGSSHKDTGHLMSISSTEIVIETRAKDVTGTVLRVHAPRHGFRVRKGAAGSQTRL